MRRILSLKGLPAAILLTIIISDGRTQGVFVDIGIEKTVSGNHIGSSVMFQSRGKWALGVFYQFGVKQYGEDIGVTEPFYGIALLAPIVKSEKLAFCGALRSGLVEQHFVVVVPGLETLITIRKRIMVGVGLGMRMGYPAISGRMAYQFVSKQ